ncbi:MAG: extracellular solute-binding protein [Lachnospiraceae bacterium]|nr:extracellular solute-binding protein [Lachnospiraceae bacterium]
MKTRKALSILLSAGMVLSLCSCGTSKTADANATAGTPTTSEAKTEEKAAVTKEAEKEEVAKPASISWWTHSGLNEEDYVKEWDAKYEEMTGVKLEHTQVSNNEYYELLEIAFASGTEPNVFDLSADTKLAYYASQGGIADLTDLVKESGIYDLVSPDIWESVSVEGRIYGIPAEMPSGAITYVRADWLKQLNMEVPKNYDEFLAMLRAFKNDIPECKVPLTVPGFKSSQNLPEFFWEATPDITYVDGKWVDGMAEENMAGAMQRLQDAYAEGLIDLEAVTNTTSACRDKWYAGEVGVFNYWAGKWGNTLQNRLQENFPDASLVGIDAIEETYYRYAGFNAYCISGRLSEEEVKQVFTYFLNFAFDGAEGQRLFYCGVDGCHCDVAADGTITYRNMRSNAENTFQSVWGTPWLAVVPFTEPDKVPQPEEMVTITLATLQKTGTYKPTMPVSQTYNMIVSDLIAIRDETIAQIVMGKVSVQDGLESYKKQAQSLGMEQALAEMNQ